MFAKIVFVVFCATLTASIAAPSHTSSNVDDDIVKTLLGSTTNVINEIAKVVSNDPDKYAVDLNALYKKYGFEEKANLAKRVLQNKFRHGIESTPEYIKQLNNNYEKSLKKNIENMKNEDPVYVEKAKKYYEKLCEYNRVVEDFINYKFDADRMVDKFISSLRPREQNLIETIKNVESVAIESIKKGGESYANYKKISSN